MQTGGENTTTLSAITHNHGATACQAIWRMAHWRRHPQNNLKFVAFRLIVQLEWLFCRQFAMLIHEKLLPLRGILCFWLNSRAVMLRLMTMREYI